MDCTDAGDCNKENGKTDSDSAYVINTGSQEEVSAPVKSEPPPIPKTEVIETIVTSPVVNSKSPPVPVPKSDIVDFTVIHNKNKYDVKFPLDDNVGQLKQHLQEIIGVPTSLQKVMIKGLAKDERTLRELGVVKGARVMVVGCKLDDVLAVSTPSTQESTEEKSSGAATKELFCKQKMHRKVLDKGIPDDVMPGLKNTKDELPPFPLSGMLNKSGGKVRLTFKLELDQVWIGTKERTDKIPMNSIKSIVSEPIEGFEQYHVMGIQLGTTEASRYWVYWVPAQYIDSIKDAILGTWLL